MSKRKRGFEPHRSHLFLPVVQQRAHDVLNVKTGVRVPAGRPILVGALMLWEARKPVKLLPIGISGPIPHAPTIFSVFKTQ